MMERVHDYSLCYKVNFVPGVILILFVLILVVIMPSTTKIYGYISIIGFLIWYGVLVVIEKEKVASKIILSDEGIIAKKLLSRDIHIKWNEINLLRYTGRGLFLFSGKVEKYLYAEVIAYDVRRCVFRREIQGFQELIQLIESRTGKSFSAESL